MSMRLGFLFALVVLIVSACQSDEKSAFDLEIGDCIVPPEVVVGEAINVDRVTIVDCADFHDGEVMAVFNTSGGTYPGEEVLFQRAVDRCPQRSSFYFYPSEDSWKLDDDREIACILEAAFDLRVGDCINYAADANVSRTSCSGLHDAQVLDVLGMPDGAYPGEIAIDDFALQNCPFAMDTYMFPSPESWGLGGDREIVCLDE